MLQVWQVHLSLFLYPLSLSLALIFPVLLASCESIQQVSVRHLGHIGPVTEERGGQLDRITAQEASRSNVCVESDLS